MLLSEFFGIKELTKVNSLYGNLSIIGGENIAVSVNSLSKEITISADVVGLLDITLIEAYVNGVPEYLFLDDGDLVYITL